MHYINIYSGAQMCPNEDYEVCQVDLLILT